MPEVSITIGGRKFDVSCQEGEEHYLHAAAQMLDEEAQTLVNQVGRMPEGRMLLMAGLMLADKTASVEDKVRAAESALAKKEAELQNVPTAEPERIEVPVVPASVTETMAELAARAEALAAQLEEKNAG